MKGKKVVLINTVKVGTDSLNRPIYEEKETIVENVLYTPGASSDVISSTDLTGKKMVYTLAIPKGDTNDWKNCKVRFLESKNMSGMTFKSFGFPMEGIDDLIPGQWNKKVTVELYE